MFILKFDGYYPTTSNNNQIIVNKTYNYKITVEYDDKNGKRFIKMKNLSALDEKRNCYIELDNVQAFIMKDSILFVQIDNLKTGKIKFINYIKGLSDIGTLIPQEYILDILKDSEMIYYGKLSFVLSGSDIFNRVEVLNMSLLNKSIEKIDFNDLELIIDAIDFKRVAIEINAMQNKMVEYRDQLRLSYDKINNLNYIINLLNEENNLRKKSVDFENNA